MSGCSGCSFRGVSTALENAFVGVRFREEGQLTLCSSGDSVFACGDRVVVDTTSGPAVGTVEQSPMPVFKPCQKSSARPILRVSSREDLVAHERQLATEDTMRRFAREQARHLGLEIKPSSVECSLDGSRATVYFSSESRVDFRELVTSISRRFNLRVRMLQLGPRDEAKKVGGVGVCGRTVCCSSWMKGFQPISIRMAKRQGLSLNPSKISGQCGRLLCCLAYENDQYPGGKKPRPKRSKNPSNVSVS